MIVRSTHNLCLARATTEPKGFGFAGGSLKEHLTKDFPGATAYAVDYPVTHPYHQTFYSNTDS
jgi:hypothetical protein